MPKVNRGALESFYQQTGQVYDDAKTEGALEVLADQIDANDTEFNDYKTTLSSTTTGDSGAEYIGVEPIVGIAATNVQDALEQLRVLLNGATAGSIPDGSITEAKLSFDPATQLELDTHAKTTSHVPYAIATGSANAYEVTLSPVPTSYVEGMAVAVKINALNQGDSTINVNGLGAKAVKKPNGNDVAAGSLKVGIIYTLRYNGTNFILQGEGGEYGTAGAGQVLNTHTVGTENGVVQGTIAIGNSTEVPIKEPSSGNGAISFIPPNAYWDGVKQCWIYDPDFIAPNILNTATIFGLQGAAIAGKRYATGSATSDVSGNITASGLAFQPRVIVWHYGAAPYNYYGSVRDGDSQTNSYNNGVRAGGSYTIISNGFTMDTNMNNQAGVVWEAFE